MGLTTFAIVFVVGFIIALLVLLFRNLSAALWTRFAECVDDWAQRFRIWVADAIEECCSFFHRVFVRLEYRALLQLLIYGAAPIAALSGAFVSLRYFYGVVWIPAGICFPLARKHWGFAAYLTVLIEATVAVAAGLPWWTWTFTALICVTFVRLVTVFERRRWWYTLIAFIITSALGATWGTYAVYSSDALSMSMYAHMSSDSLLLKWFISDVTASATIGMFFRRAQNELEDTIVQN